MNKKLSHYEVSVFCTQLALLLSAGITPYESICLMLEDNESTTEMNFLHIIKDQLMEGETLSTAIISTNLFPSYMVEMLILGEETGSLDKILSNLSDYYNQEYNLKESIKNALIYPFMMVFIMLFMILVLLVKILPTINQVYLQLGSTITGVAAGLFRLSNFLQSISLILYIFFFAFLVMLIFSYQKLGKDDNHYNILLHFKLAKDISIKIAYSRFASCLALITSSGIDLYDGLNLVKHIIHNSEFDSKIDNLIRHLKEDGDYIYEAIRKENIFNPIHVRMLQIAYKAGNAEDVLVRISNDYKDSVNNKIDKILNTIEPTLVIIFSVIVGMILISALLPLIGIMSTIG